VGSRSLPVVIWSAVTLNRGVGNEKIDLQT